MRVLVTGSTTPTGVEIVNQLLADPNVDHVLAVALEPDAVPDACPRPRFTYEALDLTRTRALRDLLFGPALDLKIDTVIHGALHRSAAATGPSVHALNVETTRQLVVECARHPTIGRFVHRSAAEVYAVRATEPDLLDEDVPLELDPTAPQWVRDRVEADLTVCARFGNTRLSIAVLRCAEVLAADTGSQLWDYLQSRVCFRPLGFDPMMNVLSVEDYGRAVTLAAASAATGVFNIPGADTLPLSAIVQRAGRRSVPIPGPLISPLYLLRRWSIGLEFRYDLNLHRFHFGGILDGSRAARELGFRPRRSLWPRPGAPASEPAADPHAPGLPIHN